jgi:hypothetical protein
MLCGGEETQVGRIEIPSTGSGQALHFTQNAPFRMTGTVLNPVTSE